MIFSAISLYKLIIMDASLILLPDTLTQKKMVIKKIAVIFFASFLYIHFALAQAVYTPVDAGSKISFTIKNFGFKTGGGFTGLKGAIHFDPANPAAAHFEVSVAASTINTDNGTRDKHLKKEEYFDVAKYPTLSFKSTKVTAATTAGRYVMMGNLTIKGVTKPVQFGFAATVKDGGYLFESDQFEINRRDFNVGGSSISMQDKLKIILSVFAKK